MVRGSNRRRELDPALTIGGFDVFSFHKRTLVQQGNAISLIGEFVKLLEKVVPGRIVGAGVNGIDREYFFVISIGEQRTDITANVVGAERHVAAEAGGFEVLIGEVEVGAQGNQPLRARKGPECEGISGVRWRAVVVDDLIGSEQCDASEKMKG